MTFFKLFIKIFLLLSISSCNAKNTTITAKIVFSTMQHFSTSFTSNTYFLKNTKVGFDEKILNIIGKKEIKNIETELHNILGKVHPYESIIYVVREDNLYFFLAKNRNQPEEGLDFLIGNLGDSDLSKKMLKQPIELLTSICTMIELKSNGK